MECRWQILQHLLWVQTINHLDLLCLVQEQRQSYREVKNIPLRPLMVKNTIFDPFAVVAPKDGRVSCNEFLTEETLVTSNTSETKRKEVGCA